MEKVNISRSGTYINTEDIKQWINQKSCEASLLHVKHFNMLKSEFIEGYMAALEEFKNQIEKLEKEQ